MLRRTVSRIVIASILLLAVLVSPATPGRALSIVVYKLSVGDSGVWYTHAYTYTLYGGYHKFHACAICDIYIQTAKTKTVLYQAAGLYEVYLNHPSASSSKSRCKWLEPGFGSQFMECARYV